MQLFFESFEKMFSRIRHVTDISNYKKENISPLVPNQREIPGVGKQKYTEFPFRYRHAIDKDNKIESLFLIQGTKVTIENGIQPPNPKFITDERAVPPACTVKIDMIGEDGRRLERLILDLRDAAAEAAFKNKMALGSFGKRIDNVDIAKSLISPPIYYRYGPDGQPDSAKPPSKYLQLVEYDRKIKTTFKVPTGRGDETRTIEPELLFHKTIVCIPTYWAKRFFVGANASVQIYLESAIVVDIVEQVNAPVQSMAIRAAVEANPEAVERMNRMLGIASSSSSRMSVADDEQHQHLSSSPVNASRSGGVQKQQDDDLPDWVKAGSSSTSAQPTAPPSSQKQATASSSPSRSIARQSDQDDNASENGDDEQPSAGNVNHSSSGGADADEDEDKFKDLDNALTSTASKLPPPPAPTVRRIVRKTTAVA